MRLFRDKSINNLIVAIVIGFGIANFLNTVGVTVAPYLLSGGDEFGGGLGSNWFWKQALVSFLMMIVSVLIGIFIHRLAQDGQ